MSGNIFFTGLSGLNAARSALLTTAHNTANVYTPGYSRQRAEFATGAAVSLGSGYYGTGAQVTTVTRSYDAYLTAQLAGAQSASAAFAAYGSQINRIDSLLADKTAGLSPLMQKFFSPRCRAWPTRRPTRPRASSSSARRSRFRQQVPLDRPVPDRPEFVGQRPDHRQRRADQHLRLADRQAQRADQQHDTARPAASRPTTCWTSATSW